MLNFEYLKVEYIPGISFFGKLFALLQNCLKHLQKSVIMTSIPVLSLSFLIALHSLHPLHVSVTEIEYDSKDRQLEIMTRIFIDDLELSIRNKRNQADLDILNPGRDLTTNQLVKEYLGEHFKISLDGKLQKTVYLGYELEGQAMICYIEVTHVKKWKQIEIMNSVIMETYDDQSNLVHVTFQDTVKSLRLVKNNPAGKLTF
jgi:hypothetical protein